MASVKPTPITLTPEAAAKFYDEVAPSLDVAGLAQEDLAAKAAEAFNLAVTGLLQKVGLTLPQDDAKIPEFLEKHNLKLAVASPLGMPMLRTYRLFKDGVEVGGFSVTEGVEALK